MGESEVAGWGGAAREFVERPGEFGISVLFVAMGVGGVLGAPLARRFNSAGTAGLGARLGRSMAFDGCGLALFSLMPSLWGAALVLVAREVNFAVWWTAQQTILMRAPTTPTPAASCLLRDAHDADDGRLDAPSGAAADSLGIAPLRSPAACDYLFRPPLVSPSAACSSGSGAARREPLTWMDRMSRMRKL